MIIQGSPEILRGPRGLNGFGDFAAADTQISSDANLEFMKSLEYMNWARSIPKLVVDYTTGYDSPIFGPQPGGTFGPAKDSAYQAFISRGGAAPVLTDAIATNLMYQASTTGASTLVMDAYGGYEKVKQTSQDAGFTGDFANMQAYEIANNLPESASTILNKQYAGPEGEARFAQFEAAINSQDEALAAQARADSAAMAAAADAAFAVGEAARKKVVADAYAAAQAAAAAAAAVKTQAALELRARALVAVKALYMQVLEREGDEAGLNYFADRFGDVIDPEELQIFKDMSRAEIAERDKYIADMATTARLLAEAAAATARAEVALAASIAADAAKAKAVADEAVTEVKKTVTEVETGGVTVTGPGINPMLILAAAAAAFFIGG